MSEMFSKMEVITGVARRRRFTTEQKLLVVNETLQPGMSISYVARNGRLTNVSGWTLVLVGAFLARPCYFN